MQIIVINRISYQYQNTFEYQIGMEEHIISKFCGTYNSEMYKFFNYLFF
jgi:hypothetical protein